MHKQRHLASTLAGLNDMDTLVPDKISRHKTPRSRVPARVWDDSREYLSRLG